MVARHLVEVSTLGVLGSYDHVIFSRFQTFLFNKYSVLISKTYCDQVSSLNF